MGNASVNIFAVLMMVRGAAIAPDLAYPPHAATCSSVWGGGLESTGGKPGIAGGGLVTVEHPNPSH